MGHTLHRLMTQNRWHGGHLTPANEGQPLLFHNNLEHLPGLIPAKLLLGKEKHAHAVLPLLAEGDAKGLRHLLKKGMRNLGQNPDAVAGFALRVLPGPMLQILHDLKGVLHDLTALSPLNIHAGPDPAVIVLKLLPVKRRYRTGIFYIKHVIYLPVIALIKEGRKEPFRAPLCDL